MSPSESTSGDQRLLATGADMGHLQPLLCLLSALAAASNQFASRTEVSVYDLGGNSSASILATPARRQLLLAAFPGARFATPPWSRIPAWGQLHPEASEESARKGHYAWKAAIVAEQLARAPEGACVLWLDAEVQIGAPGLHRFCAQAVAGGGFASPASTGTLRQWTSSATLDAIDAQTRAGLVAASIISDAGNGAIVPADSTAGMCDAGMVALVGGSPTAQQIVRAWLACSLKRRCIAPRGSNRANHRQDQTALSLVVYSLSPAAKESRVTSSARCVVRHERLLGERWGARRAQRTLCPALAKRGMLGALPAGERRFDTTGALAVDAARVFADAADQAMSEQFANAKAAASRPRLAAGMPLTMQLQPTTHPTRLARVWADRNARARGDELRAWLSPPHSEAEPFLRETRAAEMWTLFPPTYPCFWTLAKAPSAAVRHDGGKWACGLPELGAEMRATAHLPDQPPAPKSGANGGAVLQQRRRRCVAYSFGSENKFHFEAQLQLALRAAGAPGACEVHTFDPTVVPWPSPYYSAFHPIGLGAARGRVDGVGPVWPLAELLVALGHDDLIDLLKIDVEGAEWEALAAIDWATLPARVGQILLEIHPCAGPGRRPGRNCRRVAEVLAMWTKLEAAGYRLFSLEPVTMTDRSQVEVSWIHRQWSPAGWMDDVGTDDDITGSRAKGGKGGGGKGGREGGGKGGKSGGKSGSQRRRSWLDRVFPGAAGRRLSLAWRSSAASSRSSPAAQPSSLVAAPASTTRAIGCLNVGLARTLMHRLVVRAYHALARSFEAQGYSFETFLVLADENLGVGGTTSAWKDAAARAYRAAAVVTTEPTPLRCNPRCATQCVLSKANHSVVLFLWLQQFERIRLAYESVTAHEARVGARFEWLLKVRPDLLFLGELPPLAALPPQHVFVPRGVMTSDPSLQRLNDHVFLCPRDMCAGHFVHPTAAYRACVGSALATFVPPQRLLHEPYGSHEIILINLSYTIARAGGPDCGRLETTGRVAPNLLAAFSKCMEIRAEWRAAARKERGGA